MRHLITIAILLTAVLLISGCAPAARQSQTQAATQQQQGRQAQAVPTQAPPTQTSSGETYLGKASSYIIALKQFSGQADNIATGKYSDACPISILGEHVSGKEPGKAQIWSYKYYSKSANKALVVEVQTKLTASGVDVYASSKDTLVFREEPYLKCVLPINDLDSDAVAQSSGSFSGPVTISLENEFDTSRDIYVFSDGTKEVKINAVTGQVLV